MANQGFVSERRRLLASQYEGRVDQALALRRNARFADAKGIGIVQEFAEAETDMGSDALDRRPQWQPPRLARQSNAR